MATSILGVLPSIDRTFSQCFWLRDVYVFDSSHLNSGVVPSISSSLQSRQYMRGLVAVVSRTKIIEGWTILKKYEYFSNVRIIIDGEFHQVKMQIV